MENQKKKYGFVRTRYDPIEQDLIYSENAEDYIHIIFLEDRNLYFQTGKTRFYQEKIPIPYNLHEFTEFYKEKPPRITNNNLKTINSLNEVLFVDE
ncbi:hypothetical protein DSAG12_03416 [Promethearchaeum syntrophicum]|uniref:Uncharacterized protein n=1 Tax=Promethearchaeum syntrophicum TaxID=2594042 RepID=A0A5B9DE40_9ARCH|nr:hypothetical protein [Candidatus Prometheoarchaeum syntrophicum]QEE17579.1 hypothetical protein DSAG12_03416 [Candidatus Prometheoarchaeum syntrophicum]